MPFSSPPPPPPHTHTAGRQPDLCSLAAGVIAAIVVCLVFFLLILPLICGCICCCICCHMGVLCFESCTPKYRVWLANSVDTTMFLQQLYTVAHIQYIVAILLLHCLVHSCRNRCSGSYVGRTYITLAAVCVVSFNVCCSIIVYTFVFHLLECKWNKWNITLRAHVIMLWNIATTILHGTYGSWLHLHTNGFVPWLLLRKDMQ